jgi:hypothetical protein
VRFAASNPRVNTRTAAMFTSIVATVADWLSNVVTAQSTSIFLQQKLTVHDAEKVRSVSLRMSTCHAAAVARLDAYPAPEPPR